MISSPIPSASPTAKACIEILVQQCLSAQGQVVAPYEAKMEAIVFVSMG